MTVYVVEVFTDLCSYNEVHLFDTYEKALACWDEEFSKTSKHFFPSGVPPKEEVDKMIGNPLTDLYAWDVEGKHKFLDGYPDDSRTYIHLTEKEIR